MKQLLSILIICSIGFTQELTVDGNLNVTGTIANQTIDSLLQVIQNLQSQINSVQSEILILNQKLNTTLKLVHFSENTYNPIVISPNSVNEILLFHIETRHYGYSSGNLKLMIDGEETLYFGGLQSGYNDSNSEFNTDIFYFHPTEEQKENGFTIQIDTADGFGVQYLTIFVYGK